MGLFVLKGKYLDFGIYNISHEKWNVVHKYIIKHRQIVHCKEIVINLN